MMRRSEKVALRDHFLDVLRGEAAQRRQRDGLVRLPGGCYEPAWVLAEREAMWRAVNDERERRNDEAVQIDEVSRVEGYACGHVDYAEKFALYCAELALGEREVRP